jgi:TRAP transporter 4TM/12TM fusion protein
MSEPDQPEPPDNPYKAVTATGRAVDPAETGSDTADVTEFDPEHQRKPGSAATIAIGTIAVGWSLFQLAVAGDLLEHRLDSIRIRSVHLGFAMLLLFLGTPMLRKPRFGLKALADTRKIPIWDICLAGIGCAAALYMMIEYQALAQRPGQPIRMDIIVGVVLVLLLLEATRRAIGPALAVIALLFTAYAFFAEYMPMFLAGKNVSLLRYIEQMTLTDAGIYGVPLDVSAKVVFLFVLFGSMLDRAGGGRFFIGLALSLLGRFRGGPAKAAVLGSGLTGMISGSSIANIVTTGTFTIPLMKEVGYPAKKAAAIEVAASTDGQLAPPIMGAAAFIIAEYVNVPYVDVIKAAAIPAFASYVALFYITHLEACKLGLRGIAAEKLESFFAVLRTGTQFLVPIFVLLYLLIIKRWSPEVSAFHAIWVLAIIMLLQHPVRAYYSDEPIVPAISRGITDIFSGLAAGARNMVAVALATAAAGIIVGIVALGLGGMITEIIGRLAMGNIFLLLVITAIASLILGMGLPTTATYIVMASLIAPAIVTIGGAQGFVVPLIAAHLFVFYFGILADDTPPVGLAAYAAAAIAKSPPIATGIQAFMYDIRTAILPFMFIFNSDLILHNINRWDQGLLVFAMACAGNCAFAAATQGWFITRVRWYEVKFFLAATLILMRPDLIARWLNIDHSQRYWTYLLGLGILGVLYLVQKHRTKVPAPEAGG